MNGGNAVSFIFILIMGVTEMRKPAKTYETCENLRKPLADKNKHEKL